MLPVKIRLKQIGPYVDETIDFAQCQGDVIAIVGENGAGKTFLADSVYAALYRSFPYREDFYKYCQGKDAQISFDFKVDNRLYRTVININSVKREMQPWLFRANPSKDHADQFEVMTDGKNATFDKATAKLCGDPGLVLASAFSAQNRKGSFFGLAKAKRKDLFLDMLGLGKLQGVSDEAKQRAWQASNEFDLGSRTLENARTNASAGLVDIEPIRQRLEIARGEVVSAELVVKTKTLELGGIRGNAQQAGQVESRKLPLVKRKQSLEKELVESTNALDESQRLAVEVPKLRTDIAGYDIIDKEHSDLQGVLSNFVEEESSYHRKMTAYTSAVGDVEKQLSTQRGIVSSQNKALKRAQGDSSIIDTVPCHAEDECADCQFLVNAIKAKDTILDLTVEIDNATASVLALEQQLKELVKPDGSNVQLIQKRIASVKYRMGEIGGILIHKDVKIKRLARAEAASDIMAALRPRIEKIKTDLELTRNEIAVVDNDIAAAATIESAMKRAERELDLEQEALDGARGHLNETLAELSRAELGIKVAAAARDELTRLEPALAKIDRDRKEWSLLEKAFGKTGIQSLEIDAAGPAVSEIVNDLLFSCFGPRFSIRFITQVLKDDKSGYKDDFDIYVTDSEGGGREGSIDDLSGGEKVIICEAVSLAICLFNGSRGQLGWSSLWRDEASSAVDDRRAPQYINMLRKARELGHFERLFFIAHQQRATEAADSRIQVVRGKVVSD